MRRLLACVLSLVVCTAHGADAGPDFSHIRNVEQAEAEVAQGRLIRSYLFPLELGGPEEAQNVLYLPAGMEDAWRAVVGSIGRFAEEGLVDGLSVEPTDNGASLVPCRLKFVATSSNGGAGFEPTLELWSCS